MSTFRPAAAAALAALALVAPATAAAQERHASPPPLSAAPYDDAGYWAFADRMQQRLDRSGTSTRLLPRRWRRRRPDDQLDAAARRTRSRR